MHFKINPAFVSSHINKYIGTSSSESHKCPCSKMRWYASDYEQLVPFSPNFNVYGELLSNHLDLGLTYSLHLVVSSL